MSIGSIGGSSAIFASGMARTSHRPRISQLASEQLSSIDTNGDGSISQDELKAALDQLASTNGTGSVSDDRAAKLFQKIDTDGDGKISSTEWSAFQQKVQSFQQGQSPLAGLASKAFSSLDTNGDGTISQDELAAALGQSTAASGTSSTDQASKLFQQIDANGDGKISSTEWSAFQQRAQTMGHHGHHHHGGGAEGASDSQATQGNSLNTVLQNLVSQLYKSADSNGDGQLSQNELTGFLQQTFGGSNVNLVA